MISRRENKADLHMHTLASDGGYSPSELVRKCAEANVTLIAITDHDTTSGLPEAAKEAARHGLSFVNGIELSTRFNEESIDILGYGIDPSDASLQDKLAFHRNQRMKRMTEMIGKCREQGFEITEEDVKKFVTGDTYSRPHLAKALEAKGYVRNVADAFDRFIGYGRPCYVQKAEEMDPREAIQLIHSAGGAAVLAHPVYYQLDDEVQKWVRLYGLDGIEIYHRDHSEKDIARFKKLAEQIEQDQSCSLFRTGGSDFHHESYGRTGEEIGLTKLPFEYARSLADAFNVK
ncbi:PHP domain-containing protein [Salisediminibacterium halotolerans]|nr:PHP domain-containing protein [Salisediminibacterium haloalkalitolerans]